MSKYYEDVINNKEVEIYDEWKTNWGRIKII